VLLGLSLGVETVLPARKRGLGLDLSLRRHCIGLG